MRDFLPESDGGGQRNMRRPFEKGLAKTFDMVIGGFRREGRADGTACAERAVVFAVRRGLCRPSAAAAPKAPRRPGCCCLQGGRLRRCTKEKAGAEQTQMLF